MSFATSPQTPSTESQRKSSGFRVYLPFLVIAVIVFLVYGRTITFDFLHWDDFRLILQNPMINPPAWDNLGQIWTHPHVGMYIPLTYSLWLAIAAIAWTPVPDYLGITLNPFIFHLANLGMQCICAWLVFAILRILLQSEDRRMMAICLAGALFWALHPFQVEPVAWITGMKDFLSGALALAALLTYLRVARQNKGTVHYLGAAALLLLASLAKPGIIGIPLIALVLDVLLLGRCWRKALLSILPMATVTLPALVWQIMLQPAKALATPIWTRPLLACHALTFYLRKLVWPDVFTIDYGLNPHWILQHKLLYLAWILPLAISIAILACPTGRRILLASWLLMLLALAPVLGLVPFNFQIFSLVADRYMHLALLGPTLAFCWLLKRLPFQVAIIAAIVICGGLGIRSYLQCQVWTDNLSLAQNCQTIAPSSIAGYHIRACDLWGQADSLRQIAGELPPGQRQLTLAKATALEDQGIAEARQVLAIRPDFLATLQMLAGKLAARGNSDELLELIERACDIVDALPPQQAREFDERDRLLACEKCLQLHWRLDWAARNVRKYLTRHPNDQSGRLLLEQLTQAPPPSTPNKEASALPNSPK